MRDSRHLFLLKRLEKNPERRDSRSEEDSPKTLLSLRRKAFPDRVGEAIRHLFPSLIASIPKHSFRGEKDNKTEEDWGGSLIVPTGKESPKEGKGSKAVLRLLLLKKG